MAGGRVNKTYSVRPYPAEAESGNVFMPEYGDGRGIYDTFHGNTYGDWRAVLNGGNLIEKKRI